MGIINLKNGTNAKLFLFIQRSKCRLGLLPVNFPRPQHHLSGRGSSCRRGTSHTNAGEGTTHRDKSYTPPMKGLPPFEGGLGWVPSRKGKRAATAKTSSLAREEVRVGLFPVRGKAAFTLAEVLITLAIIGVVAALTLPTLIAKVNEKVDGNQKKVTKAKLIQGLNMLDLHGGINNTYSSTAEFAEELSKYMKITKICDGTNSAFSECIPYSEITYNNGTEDKTVEITKLNTANSLGLGTVTDEQEFMAPVAMVLADGTPMFLTYNKKCISDPDSIKSDNKKIHGCVDGLYDLNGSRMPNRVGKDLTAMNKASINIAEGPAVLATIAGYDIIKQADSSSTGQPPAKNCEDYLGNSKYPEITHCPYSGETDYWVGAVVTCRDMGGHLPTMTELADIAKAVYPRLSSVSAYQGYQSAASWDTTEVAKLGIDPSSVSGFILWSSEEYSSTSDGSRFRDFGSGGTYGTSDYRRYYDFPRFVCLADN
ncbi:type II secretion system protein [bacterium]|nr:type II secretion system protein [bacterium]